MGKIWTKKEITYLENNYQFTDIEIIKENLSDRTWDAVKIMAAKKGIKRISNSLKKANLEILLEESELTYYWIGFLLADGHFSKTNKIRICLSGKDKSHVDKFSKYISYRGDRINKNEICSMDYYIVPLIKKKFGIEERKTYKPPSVSKLNFKNDDLFVSMLIGFIDGDGCIQKQHKREDCKIVIKLYKSWLSVLQYMANRIYSVFEIEPPEARINNCGYASICISNFSILRYLKKKTTELDLPVLERKWNKINENNKTRQERVFEKYIKIKGLLKKGLSRNLVCEKLGIKYNTLCSIIYKFER